MPNDRKDQKVNLPVSLAGLGARMAVSRKGSGIEGSKVDARRSSRAGIGIDGELTAARPPERNICAPVMRREPLERPCKSLPKPSKKPSLTRVATTSLQKDQVFARTLVICFAMRNVATSLPSFIFDCAR